MKLNKKNIKSDLIVISLPLGFVGFIVLLVWGFYFHRDITKIIIAIAFTICVLYLFGYFCYYLGKRYILFERKK